MRLTSWRCLQGGWDRGRLDPIIPCGGERSYDARIHFTTLHERLHRLPSRLRYGRRVSREGLSFGASAFGSEGALTGTWTFPNNRCAPPACRAAWASLRSPRRREEEHCEQPDGESASDDQNWFDAYATAPGRVRQRPQIAWFRITPFILLHLSALFVFVVGVRPSPSSRARTYAIRVLGITVGYHRYFSHRAFRTGRVMQFILAFKGAAPCSAGRCGGYIIAITTSTPTARGRTPGAGQLLVEPHVLVPLQRQLPHPFGRHPDFAKYPELVFLDRFDTFVPIVTYTLFAVTDCGGGRSRHERMAVAGVGRRRRHHPRVPRRSRSIRSSTSLKAGQALRDR